MIRIMHLTIAIVCLVGCERTLSDVEGTAHLARQSAAEKQLDKSPFGGRSRARLIDTHGVRIGVVFAWQGRGGVLIQVSSHELPPGIHGVHVHVAGDCRDVGVFEASGGHVAGDGGPHGFLHPGGTHGGDLPNIYAHNDGRARADFFSAALSLSDLTDSDGAALIIHAMPDDYQSQPIGGAGVRIACAAFKPGAP
jgi:Cu-Zn family superoxide dismutase